MNTMLKTVAELQTPIAVRSGGSRATPTAVGLGGSKPTRSTLAASKPTQSTLGSPSRALLALALLTLTTACGIIPKREPIQLYEPARPSAATSASWPQANWSLLVPKPAAGHLLDSERIAVRPTPGEITVYKGVSWADPAPELVQTALLRRFEDSQKILSVSRPGAGVRGEYQLQSELRTFESVYAGGRPQAVLELSAKLVHTADGQVAAARTFKEVEPAAGVEVGSVVDAFSRALERMTGQVASWTLAEGNRHESASASKH